MNCPNCQHANAEGARFCGQCGATLTQAAAAASTTATPAARSASGSNKTVLIVLGVIFGVILLFVVGIYTAFHMVANKVRALASGDEQTTSQAQNAPQNGSDSDAQQGAQTTGNVIGNILGTDAKGKSDIGKALGNLAQTGQQIDQHDKASGNNSGAPDAQDTQQAMGAVGGLLGALGHSLGGAHRHDPVDFHSLEALLPSSLSGMQRGTPSGEANQAMGMKASSADVDFTGANDARVEVSISDATAVSGLAGIAEMANSSTESEQGDSYEKSETLDGRNVHEKWDASSKHGELSLIVGGRFGVDVHGDNVDMDALKNALGQIDLGKLESMKDANPTAQ